MKRLPALRNLTSDIRAERQGRSTVGDSADFLVGRRDTLARFEDVADLAISSEPELAPEGTTPQVVNDAKALVHHLGIVRAALARVLWARQVFIDVDVLDELLFYAITDDPGGADPILTALTRIRDAGANSPGLILLPVHSLGVLGAGLIAPFGGRITFVNAGHGYALTPQTNSMKRTLSFLREAATALGTKKGIPEDLFSHWRRSRPTTWLERNPLLVVRAVHFPGSYYGSEHLLLPRLRATTAELCMLAALEDVHRRTRSREETLFSTRVTNNFQTLDILHYIALFDAPASRRELSGHCVPIHSGRHVVSELTELPIEIDPTHWHRRRALGNAVHTAVDQVYEAWLAVSLSRGKVDARARTSRKMFESLGFFRRSYHGSASDWTAKVSLATAFEMLLTDGGRGVGAALVKRTRVLLRGVRGVRTYERAVDEMYSARCAQVHRGDAREVDLSTARAAFVLCFIELARRLPSLSPQSDAPMADLTRV